MPYGIMRQLLSNEYDDLYDTILIESYFNETTRMGKPLQPVIVGLTPTKLVIACAKIFKSGHWGRPNQAWSHHQMGKWEITSLTENMEVELNSMCPLDSVNLSIFKFTSRQSLKAKFINNKCRYFELGAIEKRKIFWKLWCLHVGELNSSSRLWPYKESDSGMTPCEPDKDSAKYSTETHEECKKTGRWLDKYLYLGSKRVADDDLFTPVALPGLGNLEFLYKNQLLSFSDTSEDGKVSLNRSLSNECYSCTYSGEPTSNVTYTSLMTTVSVVSFVVLYRFVDFVILPQRYGEIIKIQILST
ncbi:uncharacterized protein LOC105386966 [Plutella xylostella]|uniref:uncharacterized protein LOC105386966 n=1 Tax=Plutella xylostella TaxID=51655 RepID=UPI0020329CBE|nr:uncharacterized protein LOC105386966 [Plutella xylostella]